MRSRNPDAEKRTASSVKTNEGLSYKAWSKRLQRYFSHVEMLLSPDLIIVGGGISKKSAKFLPRLELQAPIVPAQLLNQSGIVGAGVVSAEAG